MYKKEIMKHSFEKHLYSGETEEEMKKDIIRQAVEYILKFESLSSELCLQGTRQKLIQSRLEMFSKGDNYIKAKKQLGY